MSKDTPILQPSDGKKSNPLTSSAEDSPASPSVSLASEKEPPMNDGSGQSLYGALAYYDPATSSLKMCQGCLLPMMDSPLPKSCGTWPRAGTMQNGIVYQHAPLTPLITGIDFGLWPTPNRMDGEEMRSGQSLEKWSSQRIANQHKGQRKQLGLSIAVKAWPRGSIPYNQEEMMRQIVRRWPTPSSNNGTGGCTGLAGGSGNRKKLYAMLGEEEGKKLGCQSQSL